MDTDAGGEGVEWVEGELIGDANEARADEGGAM